MKKNLILIQSNRPFIIQDDSFYLVKQGKVDVFVVQFDKELIGKRNYFFSAFENEIVSGLMKGYVLLCSGLDVVMEKIEKPSEEQLERLLMNVSAFIPQSLSSVKIDLNKLTRIKAGTIFRPAATAQLEVSKGTVTFCRERVNGFVSARDFMADTDVEVTFTTPKNFDITLYLSLYLKYLAFEESNIIERFKKKVLSSKAFMDRSANKLLSLFQKNREVLNVYTSPLLVVAKMIGQVEEIEIKEPMDLRTIDDIARVSKFMTREVRLAGEWWKQDNGSILGFLKNGTPIAILKDKTYYYFDPVENRKVRIDAKSVEEIDIMGYILYRPFPNKALTLLDIFKFSLRRRALNDFIQIIALSSVMGLLSTFTPIVTGVIFSAIIPEAEYNSLAYITMFLIVITITSSIFQIARSIASLRFEGRVDYIIQSAIWSRLLALPVPFFKKYNSSDLSMRANSIIQIRQMLTGAAMNSILSAIFSIFQFGLLFYYDVKLAFIGVLLTLIPIVIIAITGRMRIKMLRESLELESQSASTLMQVVNGISKFKIIGGERRAYSLWSDKFYEQKTMERKASKLSGYMSSFNNLYPIVTTIVIFYFLTPDMPVGKFLAFQAAFSGFMGSLMGLASTAVSTLQVIPLYQRAKPILEAIPEVDDNKKNPGMLSGNIRVSNVSYSYPNGPKVLKNISVDIKSREFVAFVGSSGSGKSTLMRLLLGFDLPSEGTLFLDSFNLQDLDIQAARRQMGVVLQNGKLMSGTDIFSNIVGPYNLTMEDAWRAAKEAGLERDLQEMPMGMQTVVSEGVLSGGQRQRVLIARAIVNRPRIIFFDEATSALDNMTQATVTESLNNLDATKIVVAHRLSTIINADKIYVFDKGEIVEEGSYKELMAKNGLFAELARRQIA